MKLIDVMLKSMALTLIYLCFYKNNVITKGLSMKNAPHKKLQSAMEYLMTYGWAILIIAVVIGVLYALGIFNGSGLLGSFCTAQTGYFCANPILSTNSPTLNVTIGQDTRLEWPAWKIFAVRGTAFNASSPNITGSGAFYNGEKQIVTIPLNSILGNYIPIGTPFSGSLWAEYCNTPNCNTPDQVSEIGIFSTKAAKLGYVTTSVSTSSISTTSTTSTSTTSTSTTSTATTAPTTTIVPSGIIYSVPITLTNSQSSNTPAPFQQMVNISESTYSSYLTYNGNFANFEYYTLSGNTVSVLPAWIESSNSGKLITWVKLPDGIPAESNTIIYLGFASTSNNLLSSTGTTGIGEAPQLPCGSTATSSCSTYAEYDDGANVFNSYWNFAGTTTPNGWVQSGVGIVQNNGVTVSESTGDGTLLTSANTYGLNANSILDFYGSLSTASQNTYTLGAGYMTGPGGISGSSSSDYGVGAGIWGTGTNWYVLSVSGGAQSSINSGIAPSAKIVSIYWATTSGATISFNYTDPNIITTDIPTTKTQIGIGGNNQETQTMTIQYMRIRAYPPNGVMPSTTFGVIQGGSPSVTVSPSSVSLLPGTGFTLTAAVSNGTSPYIYQWYNATSGTGIPIAGATSSTYTATAGSTAGTFDYYVKVTDSESKTVQSSNSVVTVSLPPSGIIYSVPITLTNSQSSNTPSPFQQMVNISESTYSSYITYNGNSANFEYISPSGIVLPAWIESNNSGKLITWVKLPNGIPAKSSITIYLGFASKSNNLLLSSGTTGIGEAPQLSPTYAEYDDGANVFLNYYSGASLSGWATAGTAGQTTSAPSGSPFGTNALYALDSAGSYLYTVANGQSTNMIIEYYTYINRLNDVFFLVDSSGAGQLARQGDGSEWYGIASTSSWTSWSAPPDTGSWTGWVLVGVVVADGSATEYLSTTLGNYGSELGQNPSNNYVVSNKGNYFGLVGDSGSSSDEYWSGIIIRAYPPNGVMPSTTFGVIQGGSPSVTVSPSSVSVPSGTSFTLTANVSGGTSPYTYQWYNATSGTGIPIASATSSTYTATAGSAAGTFDYYVTVTDSESPPQTAQSPNSVVTVSLPPSGITYYVPITLTNSQSSNTPAPFQQMVNISESSFSSYLTYNGNFANFEFFTSSGAVLPAWIESNNSGKLVMWVKLPNGIPAKSNTIIYLGFASTSNNLFSSTGKTGIGEAPQLPCGSTATSSCSTYAEYDDGAKVFNYYTNFAGTSLPTGWVASGTSYTTDNGIVLFSNNVGVVSINYGSFNIVSTNVFDAYGYSTATGSGINNPISAGLVDGSTSSSSLGIGTPASGSNYVGYTYTSSVGVPTTNLGVSASTQMHIFTLYQTHSTADWQIDYGTLFSSTVGYGAATSSPLNLYSEEPASGQAFVQWIRVRAYPPNGTMPSVSFGSVQGGSPSVTVSPSSVSLLPGTGFTLTATVSDGTLPYTYQWYNATSGTGIPIASATSSTYTATAGSAAGTFDYYVKVTDSESKTAQSSNSVVTVSLPPSGATYYVPITLTNSQSTATPSPFQQMVNITENSTIDKYLTYNGNFANFEYISPSGTVLPAWIESNNSGNIVTWVKLPNGIPADSYTVIYLEFVANTINLLSNKGTTGIGEAPQLSPTYAEYDDGASVFLSYFNGDASASDFTVTSGYTLTQVTGVTMPNGNTGNVIYITGYTTTSPGGWIPFVYDNGYPLQPSIIESSAQLHGNTATAQGIAGVLTNTAIASANGIGVTMGVYSSYFSQEYESSGSVTADINQQGSSVTSWIYGAVTFTGTSSTSWTGYIAPQLYSATGGYSGTVTTQPITSGTELYLSNLGSTDSGSFPYNLYINWERARTYPPNGVMPSVSFGTVS